MTLKERILRWLGIDILISEQTALYRASLELQESAYEQALAAQRLQMETAFKEALASQNTEFEIRLGVILDASLTAAEKIAKMVASQGDGALKDYVDGCLNVYIDSAQLSN